MSFQEVSWIRAHSKKLCPVLRKYALEWYRPLNRAPCFTQNMFKRIKQRWYKVSVIVQVEKDNDTRQYIKSLADSAGCPVIKELPVINAFSTRVNAKGLEALVKDSNVKMVWYDREVRAVLDTATRTVKASSLWRNNLTGRGIVVAVLDTGIYQHPDLSDRIVTFKDFINEKTTPYDDNGHGTHVAGDIAASGAQSNYQYKGPAPEASLVGVKVLNKLGIASLSVVIEGIQWCIENKDALNIRIINLSLGSEATQSYKDDPLCQAVEKAWRSGIVVCAAAGNDGPDPRTINSPGIDPLVITVGALDDRNTPEAEDDQVAEFSSRGPTCDNLVKPDILAPGVNIVSLRSPGSVLDKQNKKSRVGSSYIALSGTSMATPICAGIVAQLLQFDPTLKPDEVKSRLKDTANPLPGVAPTTQGAGVIDAQRALGTTRKPSSYASI